ncbi:SurA N-terminal domain-containing protein [Spirochaetota bacterium]
MKRKHLYMTVLSITLSATLFFFASCSKFMKSSYMGIIEDTGGKTWLAKVDGITIHNEDLQNEYTLQIENSGLPQGQINRLIADENKKKEYLNQMVDQYVIYNLAKKDGMLTSKDFTKYLKIIMRNAVFEYYLRYKLLAEIKVSEDEIEEYYNRNKEKYTKRFGSEEEMEIIQIIRKEKLKKSYAGFIENLRKNAEIKRNEEEELAR